MSDMTPISINEVHYRADDPNPFPYIIERVMSGAYLRREVFFLEERDGEYFFNLVESHEDHCYIDECDVFVEGKITDTAREKLINIVSNTSQTNNCRMCVVFSTDNAVYCEPDGSKEELTEIPTGGVLFVPS